MIRGERHHAQCTICAELSARRAKSQTNDEKMAVQEARELHLQRVFADRSTDDRQSTIARLSGRPHSAISSGRLFKLDLDGMDQAKCLPQRPQKKSHLAEVAGRHSSKDSFAGGV